MVALVAVVDPAVAHRVAVVEEARPERLVVGSRMHCLRVLPVEVALRLRVLDLQAARALGRDRHRRHYRANPGPRR